MGSVTIGVTTTISVLSVLSWLPSSCLDKQESLLLRLKQQLAFLSTCPQAEQGPTQEQLQGGKPVNWGILGV